ncbi:hypothetical protein JCM10449v2_005985 [Rhodotorula kratochvilovae]
MADSPAPSLLATAHSLRTALVASLASPASPSSSSSAHPLSGTAPSALPALRTTLTDSLSHLRTGLAAFSALALPPLSPVDAPPPVPDADTARHNRDRDKLLTLLRDVAHAESTLLAARSEVDGGPSSTPAPAGIAETLELLAGDLGLVTFRDDAPPSGSGVVLSLGGTLMVVDVELSAAGHVERTKVAYVVGGADCTCPAASDRLQALLSGEGELQARWRGVRSVLELLKELDEATERTGEDCFARLNRALPAALEAALAGVDSPRLLPSQATLLPLLHYHSTPLASLHPSHVLPPSSLSALDALLALPGVYTASVSLAAIEDGAHADPERPYVARLSPPVPITRETGRRVCAALGLPVVAADERAEQGAEDEGWMSALLSAAEMDRTRAYEVKHPDCPLLAFSLAPPPPASPDSHIATPQPKLLATHLRFAAPAQLLAALEVLRAQDPDGERPGKRRRVAGKGMSLEELFAASPADAPLPISLHPTSSSSGPGVSLTFPFPPSSASPELIGTPLSLSLSYPYAPLPGAAAVEVHLAAPERVRALLPPDIAARLARIAEGAEDVGLAVRGVVKRLMADGVKGDKEGN